MITIHYKKQKIEIPEGSSIEDFLIAQDIFYQGFAIAINRKFINRSNYKTMYLKENDEIELIMPMQGG